MSNDRGKKKFRRAMTRLNSLQKHDPKLIRELQEGFVEAVNEHVTWLRAKSVPQLWRSDEPKGEPIDLDLLLWLQNAFTDVLAGHKNDFLEPTTSETTSTIEKRSLQRKLIEDAVFYRHCVELSLIKDPAPLETIALSYGVGVSSVQSWVRDPEFQHVKSADPEECFDPYSIRSLLEIHGEMYRKLSSTLKEH
ncbi:MAG: hypothetical protein CMF71_03460 [Magnetovibrio sp.]|nr:hypothetical protein [Magnetovibrio sp.]|tara:strand:+ start:1407 stop:1985 length:579 start_codon:yes stop_codon:yes gene_type:complete